MNLSVQEEVAGDKTTEHQATPTGEAAEVEKEETVQEKETFKPLTREEFLQSG